MANAPFQPEDPFPQGNRPDKDAEIVEIETLLAQATCLTDEVVSSIGTEEDDEKKPVAAHIEAQSRSAKQPASSPDAAPTRPNDLSSQATEGGVPEWVAGRPDTTADTIFKAEGALDDAQRLTREIAHELGDPSVGEAGSPSPPADAAPAGEAPRPEPPRELGDVDAALAAMESLIGDLGGATVESATPRDTGDAAQSGRSADHHAELPDSRHPEPYPPGPAATQPPAIDEADFEARTHPSLDATDTDVPVAPNVPVGDGQAVSPGDSDDADAVIADELAAKHNKLETANEDSSPEPHPKPVMRRILALPLDGFIGLLVCLDLPFAGLSDFTKQVIGYVALATLFMAITTWVLALYVF